MGFGCFYTCDMSATDLHVGEAGYIFCALFQGVIAHVRHQGFCCLVPGDGALFPDTSGGNGTDYIVGETAASTYRGRIDPCAKATGGRMTTAGSTATTGCTRPFVAGVKDGLYSIISNLPVDNSCKAAGKCT